ncbi:MAG TPA: CPBP family intramembrane glutamic endopeptidase [Planctomycetaceae bacterium]|nr:CPBP family intramembrane glutamic endopeptidase [Planctomycetaceae bacterium]
MPRSLERGEFLNLAAVFQGGLVVLALVLAWLAGFNPMENFRWSWTGLAWGTLAALPILALFTLSDWFRSRSIVTEFLAPLLAGCRWHELAGLAVLAGISEELLFRGVLQPWIGRWGQTAGLVGSNLIFGLAHCITPTYAVVAGLVGVYLGLLLELEGEANLLIPITTHAVYDFLAFAIVVREYRRGLASGSQGESPENGPEPESL